MADVQHADTRTQLDPGQRLLAERLVCGVVKRSNPSAIASQASRV
jgi:hypothetical protein